MDDDQSIVPDIEYTKLLLQLSFKLSAEDIQSLKFGLRRRIPAGKREKLKTAYDIFEHLERIRFLGPDNLHGLETLLQLIEKLELCDTVRCFMESRKRNKLI